MGDSGAACPTKDNAEPIYDTRPPPQNRLKITLGDGSTKKVEFIGKMVP